MAKKIESTSERLAKLEQRAAAMGKDTTEEGGGTGGAVVCYYDDKKYSPGSRTCQEGKRMICQSDGSWKQPDDPSDQDCSGGGGS